MSWWFDPARGKDCRDRIGKTGATDFSLTLSTTQGVRVRTMTWKDHRGWVHHHQSELHLDPSGLAPRNGDRFIAPASETVSFESPHAPRSFFVHRTAIHSKIRPNQPARRGVDYPVPGCGGALSS